MRSRIILITTATMLAALDLGVKMWARRALSGGGGR